MSKTPEMITLVSTVIATIEKRIRDGRYRPGEQLVERELAADLGVSRIPVREALRRLAALRILEIRPYRGAIVRKLSRRGADDVMDVLRAIGILSITKAAERIVEGSHRRRLAAYVEKNLGAETRERTIKDWMDLNYPFYHLIAEISGNRLLPDLSKQYQLQLYRLVWNFSLTPKLRNTSVADQLSIATAILDGDAELALRAYEKTLVHVQTILREMPDSVFAAE